MPRNKSFRKNNYHYVEKLNLYLPRVTSILNIIAKPQLVNWAAKTAAKLAAVYPQEEPEEIVARVFDVRDTAADIGTQIHNIIKIKPPEELKIEDCEERFRNRIFAYLTFLKLIGFKALIFSEMLVFSKQFGYAGHADQGFVTEAGLKILVDYKTGNLYDEVGLQLVAYEHALLEMGIVDKFDQKMAVQLNDDGTFRMQDYNDKFESFLHALGLWKWKNKIDEL